VSFAYRDWVIACAVCLFSLWFVPPSAEADCPPTIVGPAEFCELGSGLYDAGPGADTYEWFLDGDSISTAQTVTLSTTPPGPHTLEVHVTEEGGACDQWDSIDITVLAQLTTPSLSVLGFTQVCTSCTGGTASVTYSDGGIVTQQWGYRITSGSPNPITNIPGATGTDYVIDGADFPGVGSYYLVATATPECGSPWESGETIITVTDPASDVDVLTVTSKGGSSALSGENKLEWVNPSSGPYWSTRIVYRDDFPPTGPGDGTVLYDSGAIGSRDSYVHSGLELDRMYYYAAYVDDGTGHFSSGKETKGRPFDATGPVKWAYKSGASTLTPPGTGSVYVVSNDNLLHAINPGPLGGDWPPLWIPFAMNAPSQGRPPVLNFLVPVGGATKVVFLGSQDGQVYAVDGDTGAQVWTTLPPLGDAVQAAPSGSFTQHGGAYDLIMVGTRNADPAGNEFIGLNLSDGSVAWRFSNASLQGGDDLAMGIISGAAVVDYRFGLNRATFASRRHTSGGSSNTVWCIEFNDNSATLLWADDVGDIDGSPTRYMGRIYVGNNDGDVYAFDEDDGARRWLNPFDTGSDGPVKGFLFPHLSTSNLFMTTNDTVWSIRDTLPDATENWQVPIPSPSIPLYGSGDVFMWVGSGNGSLYQIDATDPFSPLSVELGDGTAAVGSPSLDVMNSMIYVGTAAGIVYAIEVPLVP
jgi:outer membrane protein assembly factor BamB